MNAALHPLALPTETALIAVGLSFHEACLVRSYLTLCVALQQGLRHDDGLVLAHAGDGLRPHLRAQWKTYSNAMRSQIVRHLRSMRL